MFDSINRTCRLRLHHPLIVVIIPSNPESDLEIKVYEFKMMLFGSTSSPFMLNTTLHYYLGSYNTPVANYMKQNL